MTDAISDKRSKGESVNTSEENEYMKFGVGKSVLRKGIKEKKADPPIKWFKERFKNHKTGYSNDKVRRKSHSKHKDLSVSKNTGRKSSRSGKFGEMSAKTEQFKSNRKIEHNSNCNRRYLSTRDKVSSLSEG